MESSQRIATKMVEGQKLWSRVNMKEQRTSTGCKTLPRGGDRSHSEIFPPRVSFNFLSHDQSNLAFI